MARTRGELKTLIKAHTGWTNTTDKDSLIDSLCNSALKYAIMDHDFRDLTTLTSGEIEIPVGTTTVDISSLTPTVYKVITARLLRTNSSTETGYHLPFRNRKWWDKFVIDPENNMQGLPAQVLRVKNTLYFDRPIEEGWKIRLRYSSIENYTSDETVTPSELLDLFVEYKVTADVFFSTEDMDKYALWNRRAIGNNPERPGGELGRAVRADDKEAAKEIKLTRPWELQVGPDAPFAITTQNLNWSPGFPSSEFRVWR